MNPVMTRTRYRKTNAAFTAAREYDVLDRVTNVVYAARDGTPLYALSYAYDPDGLVTRRVVVSASGAVTNSYAYDGLARLVSESDSLGNSASCAYDLCGNRLSVTTPSGTVSSAYTHNRRDADMYDAGGRVTRTVNGRGQLLDLAWNLQGELVSVSTNGVFAEGYAYDPMGRRIATTDSSGTVYHAYDGIHCVADLAPDGTLLRSYTWGSGVDNLLAVTLYGGGATNTLYAVTDPLGTVHALVDADGSVAVSFSYDSWGNLLSADGDETPAAALRFTWQGREYSNATALYSFRARWYDPASGRWLSKDPIGLEGGLNLYEAFGKNPVCFVDPTGLKIINGGNEPLVDEALKIIDKALNVAYKKNSHSRQKKGVAKSALHDWEALNNSLLTVTIFLDVGAENGYVSEEALCPKKKIKGNYIDWNPNIFESGFNQNGDKLRPAVIGLAHELGHAIDDIVNKRMKIDANNPSSKFHRPGAAPNEAESRAMQFENVVREALGIPLRVCY